MNSPCFTGAEPLHLLQWIFIFLLIFLAPVMGFSKPLPTHNQYIKAQKTYPILIKQQLSSTLKADSESSSGDAAEPINMTVLTLDHSAYQAAGLDRDVATLTDAAGSPRYIIIDSGNTDTIGITEFFIYFGTIGLAILCGVAILGLILAILDQVQASPSTSPTTYSAYGAPSVDTYS